MSINNVLLIIYVVFGKFKRKFYNKIRPFEPAIHALTKYFEQKEYLLRHSSEICSDDNSDELNTRIGNTNWCICGNCSKMEKSTESLCCCEMIEISDE